MVDGVNWNIDLNKINPFTGLQVSDGDIKIVDANDDGNLTKEEWQAVGAHYISTADNEGIAKVGLGTDFLEELSKTEGIKEFVENDTEFNEQLDIIADAYLEKYCYDNCGMTTEEKTAIKSIINQTKSDLIEKYKNAVNSANGKFDMKPIAALFEINAEKAISKRQETKQLNNEKIENYVDNKDISYLDLLDLTIGALENDNITKAEFNKMKAAAVKYLMGMILSGDINETLVSKLDQTQIELYNTAKSKLMSINEATDPDTVKTLLSEAENLLDQFIENCGAENLGNAVIETKAAQAEDNARAILNQLIDEYVESMVNANMSDEQKAEVKKFYTTCVDKYIAKLVEAGNIDTITNATLISGFEDFVEAQQSALTDITVSIIQQSSKIMDNYNNLVKISNNAKSNGNISNEEKEQIVEAATEMILSQILSGLTDVTFLAKLDPSYQSSKEWKEVKSILTSFNTSVDPDELKDLQEKAKELIKNLLNKYSGDQLVSAVDYIKPVEVSDNIKNNALFNSDIYADYEAGVTRTTGYGKQNDNSLEEIQKLAKKDLETYAEALKTQLQKELGDAYNESEVQRYINDAITDTIAIFTGNVRRECKNGYSVKNDEQAFLFKRKSGSHKGRYAYNVKALIDTFNQCFNTTSKEKAPTKLDPSLATYDLENAIYRAEGLGNDYYRNKSETVKGSSYNDEKAYAELIERAVQELKSLGEQLKISLKEEGLDIPDRKVDEWIQECIKDTIKDMKEGFQRCQPNGNVTGGLSAAVSIGLAEGTVVPATIGALYAASASSWLQTGKSLWAANSSLAGDAYKIAGNSLEASKAAGEVTSSMTQVVPFVNAALFAVNTGLDLASGNFNGAYTAIDGALTVASFIPGVNIFAIAGKAVLTSLRQWTNLFGATWGQHRANAGFYFERKSNSHSGNFGYDTQTLVNLFMNKFNNKLNEWKEEEKTEKAKSGQTPTSPMN